MTKHDEGRRNFIIGAAAGAGAVASVGWVADAEAANTGRDSAQAKPEKHGAFLNEDDAATIAAFAERLMPGDTGKPGAREAGVLNYIDLALAGAYADQQDFYRAGLGELDAYCRKAYSAPFRALPPKQQDETITAMEQDKAAGFGWPGAKTFFDTVRTHTMEGMFADPIYGGNKDFAGWRLIGFPGAQGTFTRGEVQNAQAFARAPITGLQSAAKTRRT